jgi:uncharacterized protein with von Willebrand factor type A (vWA) domain
MPEMAMSIQAREFHFGDGLERISLTESLRNAQINNGVADFMLTENDLVVEETQFKSQMSTVLMIDISHSMICMAKIELHLQKKVAMALAELITTRYPKDTLDILVFGMMPGQLQLRFTVFKSWTLSYQYGCRFATSNGYFATQTKYQQTDFMITDGKPSVRERWFVLYE